MNTLPGLGAQGDPSNEQSRENSGEIIKSEKEKVFSPKAPKPWSEKFFQERKSEINNLKPAELYASLFILSTGFKLPQSDEEKMAFCESAILGSALSSFAADNFLPVPAIQTENTSPKSEILNIALATEPEARAKFINFLDREKKDISLDTVANETNKETAIRRQIEKAENTSDLSLMIDRFLILRGLPPEDITKVKFELLKTICFEIYVELKKKPETDLQIKMIISDLNRNNLEESCQKFEKILDNPEIENRSLEIIRTNLMSWSSSQKTTDLGDLG